MEDQRVRDWWAYTLVVGSIIGLSVATVCSCGSLILCLWLTYLAFNKRERTKVIMDWRHRDEEARARALGLNDEGFHNDNLPERMPLS